MAMAVPKVTVVCDDAQLAQKLVQSANFLNQPLGEVIGRPREAYMQLHPNEPRIVLLVEPADPTHAPQLIRQLKKVNDAAPILYLSKTAEFAELREIYRAGVTDILRVPDELDQLEAILDRAAQELQQNLRKLELQAASSLRKSGTVVSVYSGKGGAGTTMISANLAQAIALNSSLRTLLIDLNLQFGGIHLMFDIHFERNLGDLKSVLRELTFSQLKNVLYTWESSGLNILLSPNHPQEAENFGGEDIELLLSACAQHFDLIVLDLPHELNEISISAISRSDRLLYVVNLERPAIVRMQSVLDVLNRYHLVKEDGVSLVINKYSKKQDVARSDLEKMTVLPIIGAVAEDRRGVLQTNMNLGRPLLMKRGERGEKGPARDIFQLAAELLSRVGGDKHVHLPKAQ
jgi:pilus assembly protein CpaE